MRVSDLLKEIPDDTTNIVAEACKTFSQLIRAQLVDHHLRWKLAYRKPGYNRTATVRIDWGEIGKPDASNALPEALERYEIPQGLERAARLSVHWPAIRGLGDHARRLMPLFQEYEDALWSGTQVSRRMAHATLYGAAGLSGELLALAAPLLPDHHPFDLVRFLLNANVDDDVLGVYSFDGREQARIDRPEDARPLWMNDPHEESGASTNSTASATIVVYWGIVGLIAAALDVSPRALAVVVLAHELSHAYTHLGHDRDGDRWSGSDFAESDRGLKEALAQYYTHLICEGLDGRVSGLFNAYWKLLEKQPEIYQLHLPLVLRSTPEKVASALAPLRAGRVHYEALLDALGVPAAWFSASGPLAWRGAVEDSRKRTLTGAGVSR